MKPDPREGFTSAGMSDGVFSLVAVVLTVAIIELAFEIAKVAANLSIGG